MGYENIAIPYITFGKMWWEGTESNRRHTDFQSVALPTELPSHRVEF
jgi:hypothetical protein